MSNLIAIVGTSGEGKSTSIFPNVDAGIKGLDFTETLYINVSNKPIPARGANRMYPKDKKVSEGGNYFQSSNLEEIGKLIDYVVASRKDIKNIVLDDIGLSMSFEMMDKALEKGFDKWSIMAAKMWKLINKLRNLPDDYFVFCVFHQEKDDAGKMKIRTAGKLLDNAIYLDSLFTFILFTRPVIEDFKTQKVKYQFMTQSDGESTCKSPIGCFEQRFISNDLGLVRDKILEYYN